jgi:uncharacterized membrane protein YgcG
MQLPQLSSHHCVSSATAVPALPPLLLLAWPTVRKIALGNLVWWLIPALLTLKRLARPAKWTQDKLEVQRRPWFRKKERERELERGREREREEKKKERRGRGGGRGGSSSSGGNRSQIYHRTQLSVFIQSQHITEILNTLFIATLFVIAKLWNQTRHLATEQ